MHTNPPDTELGALLLQAFLSGTPVAVSSALRPAHADTAYAIQLAILAKRQRQITGGKVAAELQLDGHPMVSGSGKSHAGDPRRLLPWLVNQCCRCTVPLSAGDLMTCGSYVGAHFPSNTRAVSGRIGTPAPISLKLN